MRLLVALVLALLALLSSLDAGALPRVMRGHGAGFAAAGPTISSYAAAKATAENNALCVGGTIGGTHYNGIAPFYVQIGDKNGMLFSDSVGTPVVTESTTFVIDSASKWVYAMYVVQKRGGYSNLTSNDITFLTFQSQYTAMGSQTTGQQCAPSNSTINQCLSLPTGCTAGAGGTCYGSTQTASGGVFIYDSGHMENHASLYQSELANTAAYGLGTFYDNVFGITGTVYPSGTPVNQAFFFVQPLMAGGIYTTAYYYGKLLRGVLSGTYAMHDALGKNPVCAWDGCSTGPNGASASSPIAGHQWHYSLGHWVEDDAILGSDGSFSSPGAGGWYPWINAAATQYGMISRYASPSGATGNGQWSQRCALNIRTAWNSGTQMCGAYPGDGHTC